MEIEYAPYFNKYDTLTSAANQIFNRVHGDYPDSVKCKPNCADCCYAIFDLTLVEAIYINHRFHNKFHGEKKENILERCNSADRQVYKIKRKAFKEFESGKEEVKILAEMAGQRIRCPMLNQNDMCDIYEFRPITCRLYGIPTLIGGNAHTCGISGFKEGVKYPTVNIDKIQRQLYAVAGKFVRDIHSRHVKMADMLVPLSMAILTTYDKETLGVPVPREETPRQKECGNDE